MISKRRPQHATGYLKVVFRGVHSYLKRLTLLEERRGAR